MLVLQGTLVILLLANASVDAREEHAISASKIKNDFSSTDVFQSNGSNSDRCVRISNYSSKQDHHLFTVHVQVTRAQTGSFAMTQQQVCVSVGLGIMVTSDAMTIRWSLLF